MNQPRIIVIDDDPLFRSLLTSVLKKNYEVEAFKDGSEGFYHASENPPDAAIIDVNMPGWDGLKTLRAFRAHHLTAECPIIMLTGDTSRETIMQSISGGADEYVVKSSFCRREFAQKLSRVLGEQAETVEEPAPPEDVHEPDLQTALDNWE